MRAFVFILVLLSPVCGAAAAEIKCSSADGDFQYSYWAYQGGIPPRGPATREQWTYKGKEMKPGVFSEKSAVKDETKGHTRVETYVALLTFKTDAETVQDYVLCRSQKYVGPPLP